MKKGKNDRNLVFIPLFFGSETDAIADLFDNNFEAFFGRVFFSLDHLKLQQTTLPLHTLLQSRVKKGLKESVSALLWEQPMPNCLAGAALLCYDCVATYLCFCDENDDDGRVMCFPFPFFKSNTIVCEQILSIWAFGLKGSLSFRLIGCSLASQLFFAPLPILCFTKVRLQNALHTKLGLTFSVCCLADFVYSNLVQFSILLEGGYNPGRRKNARVWGTYEGTFVGLPFFVCSNGPKPTK